MKTTIAHYTINGLIPKCLYDQVVQTLSHVALLTCTDGYSELTKKQQRAINKAWKALTEVIESTVTDDDDPFI